MKNKFFTIILVAVFLLSLVSCQTADTPAPNTDTIPSYETAADINETTVFPEETVPEATVSESIGSISTPDYEISVIDGTCYLNFTNGNEIETDSDSSNRNDMSMIYQDFITFDSIAEMKQKLVNNELTAKQQNIIKTQFTRSENGFEICNVQQLIRPVVPAGISIESVWLYGTTYTVSLKEGTGGSIGMYFGDAGKWERKLNEWMKIIENHHLDSHETETIDGITTETYVYTTKSSQLKRVFLTIPGENGQVDTHIMLKYRLRINDNLQPVSDTIPTEVFIFGEKNGIPYDFIIHELTEAPTVEWLSSFSIAPYVDNGDHAAS